VEASVSRADDLLITALNSLGEKPGDDATRAVKKRYSEQISQVAAVALAEELRLRGMTEARPQLPGTAGLSGAERRMSGGIGAKQVDCTWATEESGLLLAFSVKGVNFRDMTTKNFQKNLINRRGDLLMEAVTLHRRFPYAVMAGVLFFDKDAAHDDTPKRRSTMDNAHARMRIFTGRNDPAGRDEQYERLYVASLDATRFGSKVTFYEVGKPDEGIPLHKVFDDLIQLLAERNPDFYEVARGEPPLKLLKISK
jgi:hypothetical protein